MKKIFIALLLGSLLVLAAATTVLADNGPHGSFTATTDACANCHRAHTAQYGSNSLTIMDPEALCLSCHDGRGAGTNVEDGVYARFNGTPTSFTGEGTPGASLFGGGFTNALMATAWSGKATADATFDAVSRPATSTHTVGATGTIWGSGAVNTANGSMVLECTSCHNPHGNSGNTVVVTPPVPPATTPTCVYTAVPSYRLLRWQPSGSGGFTPPATNVNWSGGAFPGCGSNTGWLVPDNFAALGTEWYTLGTTGAFAVGDYNAGNANNTYQPTGHNYVSAAVNVAFFCAQCHDRYFNNSRLRNDTDQSVYCGAPVAGVVVNGVTLSVYADADGVAPWIHPVDPARCEPVVNTTTGALTSWGDNGASGDLTYTYRHASGDIRLSMDGTTAAGAGTSVSRTCVACHVAHGTAASMTATASSASLAKDSALLRMDNRSLCLRCHASSVGFTVGP